MPICFEDARARFKDKKAALCDNCKLLNSLSTNDKIAIAARRLTATTRAQKQAEEAEWAHQMESWAEKQGASKVKVPRDPKPDIASSPPSRRHGAKSSKRASSTGRI